MSDKPSRRRSLESLRKEAKRWFEALRQADPEARARLRRANPPAPATPTLRDVQHALALEHGFSGWTELRRRLTRDSEATARSLKQFEEMAQAMLEAYRTGTPAAMERHWALTWHRRNHRAMRTYVQLDLGRQAGAINQDDDITLDDARALVAREHGFGRWDALVKHYASLPDPSSVSTAKPVQVLTASTSDDDLRAWHSRDWATVVARLKEGDAAGLDAHGQMNDALLEDVSRIEHLRALRLSGSRAVTDSGVRLLSRMSGLRHLDLSGTGITDRALDVLRAMPGLETVSLAWTSVTDAGLAHLRGCEGLTRVDLSGTSTGDGALRALAGKPRLCQLRTGNAVTDAGLALLHELPVFKRWQGGEATMGLMSYDAGPNYLLLRGSFTDRGMTRLEGLCGLFALNLDASGLGITSEALAPLVGLPNLGWLAFDATDEAMPYIARMPRLRFLGCQDTVAGDEGFAALSASQSLEYLWGRRCHNLRTRGFAALARMPALRGLSVSCKNVEDEGVAELPRFPALCELMPIDVPDEGYCHIARCEGLESLVLMYCRETGDAATEHIARLPRLTSYFASYTRITDRTPELLSRMDSFERVTLDGCAGVTDVGVAHLRRLPRLRELRVSGPRISAECAGDFPSRVRVFVSG
jgi:hypothetical protein